MKTITIIDSNGNIRTVPIYGGEYYDEDILESGSGESVENILPDGSSNDRNIGTSQ